MLQSHLLDAMPTVVIAPMFRRTTRPAYIRVSVEVEFEAELYSVSLAELAAPEARTLGKAVGSVSDYEYELRRGLDAVFLGF